MLKLMPIPNLERAHNAELHNLQRLFTKVGPNWSETTLVGYKGHCYYVILRRQDLFEGSVYYATVLDFPTRKFRRTLCCTIYHEHDLINKVNEMLGFIQSLDIEPLEFYE